MVHALGGLHFGLVFPCLCLYPCNTSVSLLGLHASIILDLDGIHLVYEVEF